jgi:subtilase family serine protease
MSRRFRIFVVCGLVCATVALIAPVAPAASAAPANVDWGDLSLAGMTQTGPAPAALTLPVLFGLKRDRNALYQLARAVNDPSSASYGQRQSVAQVAAATGAPASAIAAVTTFVTDQGLVPLAPDLTGTYVGTQMTVTQASTIFGVDFAIYKDSVTSFQYVMPMTQPTLPAALDGLVDQVHGLVYFSADGFFTPKPRPPHLTSLPSAGTASVSAAGTGAVGTPTRTGTPAGCADGVNQFTNGAGPGFTPNQLLTAYGIAPLQAKGLQGQGISVSLVESGSFIQSGLDTFTECFGIDAVDPIVHTVGPPGPVPPSIEAQLDVQVMAMVAPQLGRLDVFQGGFNAFTHDDVVSLIQLVGLPLDASTTGGRAPDVVSVSYGVCDEFLERMGPAVDIMNEIFATGAAAGITYAVASGDDGSTTCNRFFDIQPANPVVNPAFPSSSPWVTSIGGSNLTLAADNTVTQETVWNDAQFPKPYNQQSGGGGAPSLVNAAPWYQQRAQVPANTMRQVPDLAFFADIMPGYQQYCPVQVCPSDFPSPGWFPNGGTSAATPLFAGSVALVDQALVAAGLPKIGFANPLLYEAFASTPSLANDIVLGNNDVFGAGCCAAAVGYDTASGWGSLSIQKLSQALLAPTVSLTLDPPSGGPPLTTKLVADVGLPAGTVQSYAWDTDGNGTTDATTTVPELAFTYAAAGQYTPSVTIVTNLARTATGQTNVLVGTGPADVATPVLAAPAFTG